MTCPDSNRTGIQKAADAVGGQTKLAHALGLSRQAVQAMVVRGQAPPRRIVEIEAITGVPRKELIDPRLAGLFEKPRAERS